MKMSLRIGLVLIISISGSLYAENPWVYSMGISSVDYTWLDEESGAPLQEQMLGLDIRGESFRKPTEFYYGTYISIARPIMSWGYDEINDITVLDDSNYDMYVSCGIPFGYRWAMHNNSTAFYLGTGPFFQGLFDFDSYLLGSGGIFVEFGFETVKTKGISFSIGGRVNMSLGSFVTDGSYFHEAIDAASSVFFIGVSWIADRGY